MPEPPRLTLGQRLKLLWGRPRRLYLNLLRPGYVRASLARRRGECLCCGACCRMGLLCRHLRYTDGKAECIRYDKYRTSNCRNFPTDERDIAERDVVAPDTPCGYYFVPEAEIAQDNA